MLARPFVYALLLAATAAAPRADAQSGVPTLNLTREIRIDGAVENLVSPSWIVVGRDGRMAVAQEQDKNVRFFDVNGRSIGKFGRGGQGPGEFQNLFYAGWAGDSLFVFDFRSRRTTVITPAFSLARTIEGINIKPAPGQESRWPAAPAAAPRAMYGDGSMLVSVAMPRAPAPAGFDTSGTHFFHVSRDGIIHSYVGNERSSGASVGVNTGTYFQYFATPFFAMPQFKVSDRGNRLANLTSVYEGPQANTIRMVVIGRAGDTVYARNYPFPPDAIPRRIADSVLAEVIRKSSQFAANERNELSERTARAVREQMKIPPVYPPFTSMLIADEGTAWIGLRSPPGGATAFMVLDPRGNIMGTANVPAGTRPLAVSATQMWAVELDQDDVPSIVRYRVTPAK